MRYIHKLGLLRIATVLLWIVCVLHIAANLEAWRLRSRAGQKFRFLP